MEAEAAAEDVEEEAAEAKTATKNMAVEMAVMSRIGTTLLQSVLRQRCTSGPSSRPLDLPQ